MAVSEVSISRQRAWSLFRRLALPHRLRLLLLAVLAVVQTGLVAMSPALVGVTIGICLPTAQAGDYLPLLAVGVAIVASALVIAALNYVWRRQSGEISQRVLFDLRTELFAKFQKLPIAFHERIGPGHMVNHLTSEVDAVNALFSETLGFLLQSGLGITITIVMMLVLDAYLTGIVILILLPAGLALFWSMRFVSQGFARYRADIAQATSQAVEALNGVHAIHAYRREDRHDSLFAAPIEDARVTMRTIQRVRATASTVITSLFGIAVVIVVVVGGFAVADGKMDVGILAAFVLYVTQLMAPVLGLSYTLDTLQTAGAALGRIGGVIDAHPDIGEATAPLAPRDGLRGDVTFDNVSFAYDPQARERGSQTIEALNLRLRHGEVVAMLGATGAGKSTIAKLLTRFYDPTEGRILLNGTDLRDLSEADLRRSVIMISQEGFLFSGSVADNIRVGKPDASDGEVEAAARAVGADAFIDTLPEGYATDVRKRGTRFSAGERQLIAFARASLANPAVLILDEATAALDIPTERDIQAALRRLLAGRTGLVIAHRLSTVQIADRVLVVRHGQIVEDGTPKALLEGDSPEFSALYRDGHGRRYRPYNERP